MCSGPHFDIWGNGPFSVTVPRAVAPGQGGSMWAFSCHFAWRHSAFMIRTRHHLCLRPESEGSLQISAVQLFNGVHTGMWEGQKVQDAGTNSWLYLSLQFTTIFVWHVIGLFWTPWEGVQLPGTCEEPLWRVASPTQWDPKAWVRAKPWAQFSPVFCWPFDSSRDLIIIGTAKWNFPTPNPD